MRGFFLTACLLLVAGGPIEALEALVVHDDVSAEYAVVAGNLLGHFRELDTRYVELDDVDSTELVSADVVLYVARYDSLQPSPEVRKVLRGRKGITCYFGEHRWLGLSPERIYVTSVDYRGRNFRISDYRLHGLALPFGETLVSMHSGDAEVPFILRKKSQWMVRGEAIFGVPGLIFADILHDILNIRHPARRLAMVRLEDINPSYRGACYLDPLRQCIDYLVGENIPFSMAVFPVYLDPVGVKLAHLLHCNGELSSLLREAERRGGTVIMHGTSHQYHRVSGEGSEFWDVERNAPIPNERAYFDEHMKYGLWLMKMAGLHPRLFEAPHYNLPLSLQKELGRYFDTLSGEVMINDSSYRVTQSLPYIIYRSYSGLRILPEQLGYVAFDDREFSVKRIEENLDKLTAIVRDPFACFFYHPFVAGDEYLRRIIPLFRKRGYLFVNAGDYGGGPLVEVEKVPPLWRIARTSGKGLAKGLVLVGVILCVFLACIYIFIRRRRRKDMFRQ